MTPGSLDWQLVMNAILLLCVVVVAVAAVNVIMNVLVPSILSQLQVWDINYFLFLFSINHEETVLLSGVVFSIIELHLSKYLK